MKRSSQSHLQNRILLHLTNKVAATVSALADDLGVTRSSASRAVNALRIAGLLVKDGRHPVLTQAGEQEAHALAQHLPVEVEKAKRVVNRVIDQATAANVNTGASAFTGLSAALQAATPRLTLPEFRVSQLAGEVIKNNFDLATALDSVQPRPVDWGSVAETLQSVLARAIAGSWQTIASAAAAVSGMQDIIAAQLASLIASLEPLSSWFDEIKAELEGLNLVGPVMRPIFLTAGFWVGPSTPLGLLRAIKARYDEGTLTAEELRRLFVEVYRAHDCHLLRHAVDRDWRKNHLYVERMHIFHDALEAHIAGKYTLSVTALLPQIEGIANRLTGAKLGKSYDAVNGAALKIESEFVSAISQDVLLTYITSMAYADTRKDAFYDELRRHGLLLDQVLQRHAILHGITFGYATEENSLRAFLILDALSHVPVPDRAS